MIFGTIRQYPFALLSALLLELPFPIAGPLPYWRTLFAWLGLVPLFYLLLRASSVAHRHYLQRSVFVAYVTGIAWYFGNCYWIYATMHIYGNLPPVIAAFILLGFSLYLGLYFALFGLGMALLRKGFGSTGWALAGAPVLWVAVEFAESRITSFPWDQLGYSQIDNFLLTRLAPFTGVYGISALLVGANAGLVWLWLQKKKNLRLLGTAGWLLIVLGLMAGHRLRPAPAPTQALAVLVQPNLRVDVNNDWQGPEWDNNLAVFTGLSYKVCGNYIGGLPETSAPVIRIDCVTPAPYPDLIAWPESPSPFRDFDPRFQKVIRELAINGRATVIAGNMSVDFQGGSYSQYNSASVFTPDGHQLGRYDKIHLVPFGEYVPYKNLFFFAGHLTQNVATFSPGTQRTVFLSGGHRFGIFICYESVFADEVRRFVLSGAEALVNISDDAWYGDTSAPWQHLNMARMRAVENHRWILRDTNDGVTTAIDPYGRVIKSIPRHRPGSLAVRYGFRADLTFYSAHGDLFAVLCAIIAIAMTAKAAQCILRSYR
jgi:apolipoprotein N-acyltransferase